MKYVLTLLLGALLATIADAGRPVVRVSVGRSVVVRQRTFFGHAGHYGAARFFFRGPAYGYSYGTYGVYGAPSALYLYRAPVPAPACPTEGSPEVTPIPAVPRAPERMPSYDEGPVLSGVEVRYLTGLSVFERRAYLTHFYGAGRAAVLFERHFGRGVGRAPVARPAAPRREVIRQRTVIRRGR